MEKSKSQKEQENKSTPAIHRPSISVVFAIFASIICFLISAIVCVSILTSNSRIKEFSRNEFVKNVEFDVLRFSRKLKDVEESVKQLGLDILDLKPNGEDETKTERQAAVQQQFDRSLNNFLNINPGFRCSIREYHCFDRESCTVFFSIGQRMENNDEGVCIDDLEKVTDSNMALWNNNETVPEDTIFSFAATSLSEKKSWKILEHGVHFQFLSRSIVPDRILLITFSVDLNGISKYIEEGNFLSEEQHSTVLVLDSKFKVLGSSLDKDRAKHISEYHETNVREVLMDAERQFGREMTAQVLSTDDPDTWFSIHHVRLDYSSEHLLLAEVMPITKLQNHLTVLITTAIVCIVCITMIILEFMVFDTRVKKFMKAIGNLNEMEIDNDMLQDLIDHSLFKESYFIAEKLKSILCRLQVAAKDRGLTLSRIAHASHEIRNPLTSILGMAELGADCDTSPPLEEYRAQMRTISDVGRTLINVLNDMVDLGRVDRGKMSIQRIPTDIHAVFEHVSKLHQNVFNARLLEYIEEIDSRIDICLCDSQRLIQVLTNFVSNAIKFTVSGSITITATLESESGDEPVTEWLRLSVKDTGVGIQADNLSKLFEVFSQVHSQSGSEGVDPGAGIGLALSKRLVELMDGTVGVSSEYGKGSEFWCRVPYKVATDGDIARYNDTPRRSFTPFTNSLKLDRKSSSMRLARRQGSVSVVLPNLEPKGSLTKLTVPEVERSSSVDPSSMRKDYSNPDQPLMRSCGSYSRPKNINFSPNLGSEENPADALSHGGSTTIGGPVFDDDTVQPATPEMNCLDPNTPEQASNLSPPILGSRNLFSETASVLVVDDNAVNRHVISRMLAQAGVSVQTAKDGKEAVEMVMRSPTYSLVLMDLVMPVFDGWSAISRLRDEKDSELANCWEYRKNMKIFACTGEVAPEIDNRCEKAGFDGILIKPLSRDDLVTVLWESGIPLRLNGFANE